VSLAVNYSQQTSMVLSNNALRDNRSLHAPAAGTDEATSSTAGSSGSNNVKYLYSGGGGLVSTLHDYSLFCNALLDTYLRASTSTDTATVTASAAAGAGAEAEGNGASVSACIPDFTPQAAAEMMSDRLPSHDSTNGTKQSYASLNWAKGTFSETACEGSGFGFNMSVILDSEQFNQGMEVAGGVGADVHV
jgi:CubicO group peptidase (beta-lactamase class C family)